MKSYGTGETGVLQMHATSNILLFSQVSTPPHDTSALHLELKRLIAFSFLEKQIYSSNHFPFPFASPPTIGPPW